MRLEASLIGAFMVAERNPASQAKKVSWTVYLRYPRFRLRSQGYDESEN